MEKLAMMNLLLVLLVDPGVLVDAGARDQQFF
jgi:hypothetical protein